MEVRCAVTHQMKKYMDTPTFAIYKWIQTATPNGKNVGVAVCVRDLCARTYSRGRQVHLVSYLNISESLCGVYFYVCMFSPTIFGEWGGL